MSEWRMSFCCTVMAVPTASSHERYVCRKLCVPSLPSPAAFVADCRALQYPVYEYGRRPIFTGEGNNQSSASPNSVFCSHAEMASAKHIGDFGKAIFQGL